MRKVIAFAVVMLQTPVAMRTSADAPSLEEHATAMRIDPARRRDPAAFRGRVREDSAGEVLLGIPRTLFLPVYFLLEYGVRLPLYALADWVDRNRVASFIERVLHPAPNVWWHPTLAINPGPLIVVGVGLRLSNLLVRDHSLRLSIASGGADVWQLSVQDEVRSGAALFGFRGGYFTRPEYPFYGLGPRSANRRSNFSLSRVEAFARFGVVDEAHVRFEIVAGFRSERVGEGSAPSIEQAFLPQDLPGLADVNLAVAQVDLGVDSRHDAAMETNGVRAALNTTIAQDAVVAERRFFTAELEVEAAAEVGLRDRVLALHGYLMETLALGREPVPLTHLATLGWMRHRGFSFGRFRGDAALVAELRYRYPVGYFVDMTWSTSVGSVCRNDFSDFDVRALTASFGIGFRTRRTGWTPMEVSVALGSSRFDEAFAIDSVAFYLGTTDGL